MVAPKTCPSCNSPVIQMGDLHYCQTAYNYGYCKDSIANRLVHFCVSLDIKGLAFISARELVEELDIKGLKDFMLIERHDFERVLGENGVKIHDQLSELHNVNIHKFIKGLGIHGTGESASELLFTEKYNFNEMVTDEFDLYDYSELLNVNGIGETIANNLKSYVAQNREDLSFLITKLNPKAKLINKVGNSPIEGFSVVITGAYFNYQRAEFKELLQQFGATLKTSVSKKTNIVVEGESPGANKLRDAKDKGVEILTSEQFKNLIEGN